MTIHNIKLQVESMTTDELRKKLLRLQNNTAVLFTNQTTDGVSDIFLLNRNNGCEDERLNSNQVWQQEEATFVIEGVQDGASLTLELLDMRLDFTDEAGFSTLLTTNTNWIQTDDDLLASTVANIDTPTKINTTWTMPYMSFALRLRLTNAGASTSLSVFCQRNRK